MDFNELVKIRRSCREYSDIRPNKEEIENIITTTLLAPSWKNSETGRYYVALSDEAINLVYSALPDFNKNSTANAAYIVPTFKKGLSGCGQNGQYVDDLKDSWGAYDLGLQNAYLMLKASDMGYDTLIMGLRDEKMLRDYFSIPDDEIMMPVIAIGKKKSNLVLRDRKDIKEVLKVK